MTGIVTIIVWVGLLYLIYRAVRWWWARSRGARTRGAGGRLHEAFKRIIEGGHVGTRHLDGERILRAFVDQMRGTAIPLSSGAGREVRLAPSVYTVEVHTGTLHALGGAVALLEAELADAIAAARDGDPELELRMSASPMVAITEGPGLSAGTWRLGAATWPAPEAASADATPLAQTELVEPDDALSGHGGLAAVLDVPGALGPAPRYRLAPGPTILGRDRGVDIRVAEHSVSARHARFADAPQGPTVENLSRSSTSRI